MIASLSREKLLLCVYFPQKVYFYRYIFIITQKSPAFRTISVREKRKEFLADRYGLPDFICMWDWANARIVASGGQPDSLLATGKRNCIDSFRAKGSLVQRVSKAQSAALTVLWTVRAADWATRRWQSKIYLIFD